MGGQLFQVVRLVVEQFLQFDILMLGLIQLNIEITNLLMQRAQISHLTRRQRHYLLLKAVLLLFHCLLEDRVLILQLLNLVTRCLLVRLELLGQCLPLRLLLIKLKPDLKNLVVERPCLFSLDSELFGYLFLLLIDFLALRLLGLEALLVFVFVFFNFFDS